MPRQSGKSVWLALLLTTAACAQSSDAIMPNNEVALDFYAHRTHAIVPGLSLYGVSWLSSSEEVVAQLGRPAGIYALANNTQALMYGKGHTLLFENNELREVIISDYSQRGGLTDRVVPHAFFDNRKLIMAPGLRLFMKFEEVKALLGDRIPDLDIKELGHPSVTYFDDYATIKLSFAPGFSSPEAAFKGPPDRYVLAAITIRSQ